MSHIRVIPADPSWPEQYRHVAVQIRREVGDAVVRIDHIGSTAIPELAAKDVIDIQLSVADLANECISPKLIQLGFRQVANLSDSLIGLPEDDIELRKRFFVEPVLQRRVHLHVREVGRLNQAYPLLFRDFLRRHPRVRQAYEVIKVELAARFPEDPESYYAIKNPYMDTVYEAAKRWAEQTSWQPDEAYL